MNSIPWTKFISGVQEIDTSKYEATNITCPQCKKLLFRRKDMILTSYPCKYCYECKNCGWSGVH